MMAKQLRKRVRFSISVTHEVFKTSHLKNYFSAPLKSRLIWEHSFYRYGHINHWEVNFTKTVVSNFKIGIFLFFIAKQIAGKLIVSVDITL